MFDNPELGFESFEFDSEQLANARTGRWFRYGRNLIVQLDGTRDTDGTGILTSEMPDDIFAEFSDAVRPTLRKGARSAAVRDLQQRLNSWIAAAAPQLGQLSVDGDFGSGTQAAVIAFQRAKGLSPDGVVGSQTWSALGAGGSAATSASSSPAGTSSAPSGTVDLVTIRGITVARSIAGNLALLLAAASAAGITLGGGGWRSAARQIELRRRHCGPTDFDIYQKKSSLCVPPTARPGSSMHERGLAIDFTHNGRSLDSNSPAFHWLKANAQRYGFFNLPSEPWHWSINGN
jgi:peptidoglycan hydrolase-like protein with peptidoglycan-binding domain